MKNQKIPSLLEALLSYGLTVKELKELSFESGLNKSLKNSLSKFDKEDIFEDCTNVRVFYNNNDLLEELDLEYRIKSKHSTAIKYAKSKGDSPVDKILNDLFGMRIVVDSYEPFLQKEEMFRSVDMRNGKANDDGYRGLHLYFQIDRKHYPIEIQINTFFDRQLNNWLHAYTYKKGYPNIVGKIIREKYENGIIHSEYTFRKELADVLSSSKGF